MGDIASGSVRGPPFAFAPGSVGAAREGPAHGYPTAATESDQVSRCSGLHTTVWSETYWTKGWRLRLGSVRDRSDPRNVEHAWMEHSYLFSGRWARHPLVCLPKSQGRL